MALIKVLLWQELCCWWIKAQNWLTLKDWVVKPPLKNNKKKKKKKANDTCVSHRFVYLNMVIPIIFSDFFFLHLLHSWLLYWLVVVAVIIKSDSKVKTVVDLSLVFNGLIKGIDPIFSMEGTSVKSALIFHSSTV